MTEPRLASHMRIDAMRRVVEGDGGFATVLRRGDITAGDIMLIIRERGGAAWVLRDTQTLEGGRKWEEVGSQNIETERDLTEYLLRRKEIDPDLWLIELDVADAERFIVMLGERS